MHFRCVCLIMTKYSVRRCDGMVDVADSKSAGGDSVWVRVPPPAPKQKVIRKDDLLFGFCPRWSLPPWKLHVCLRGRPTYSFSLCGNSTSKKAGGLLRLPFHLVLCAGWQPLCRSVNCHSNGLTAPCYWTFSPYVVNVTVAAWLVFSVSAPSSIYLATTLMVW